MANAKKVQQQVNATQASAAAIAAKFSPTATPVLTKVTNTGSHNTKTGAITLAHAQARAAKLQGKALPPQVSRYATGAAITVTDKTCYGHFSQGARLAAWQALLASKTVGDYLQSGHKVKYLGVWATGTVSRPAVIRIATK